MPALSAPSPSGTRTSSPGSAKSATSTSTASSNSTTRATWYSVHGPNGDLSWRVTSPAYYVGAKTVSVPDDAPLSLYYPNLNSPFPWILTGIVDGRPVRITSKDEWVRLTHDAESIADVRNDYPEHEGETAVFTRPLAWLAAHMMEMRSQGIRVLAEVDDNYLSDSRLNVFMAKAGYGENDREAHVRSICVGDGLILSTEYLRDTYWKGLSAKFGKKLVPELFVCRNHVDERYIPEPVPHDGRLRIGYMGSDSHIWDVDLIYPALLEAYECGHEIVMVGVNPALINPIWRKGAKHDWRRIRYTHIPWTMDYRGTALPLDIAFAPLRVDRHTLGKSDIKALEYHLSGAAPIVQNCLVYNRTLPAESVRCAGSPAEFTHQMRDLIRNPGLRGEMVAAGREYINEHRLLSKNVGEWEAALYA